MMARMLWLVRYMQIHRYITYDNAKNGLGIGRRTYMRYMKTLNEAGVSWQNLGRRGVYYLGFDTDMAPVVGTAVRSGR